MKTELAKNGFSNSEIRRCDHGVIINEPYTFENILYVGSQIGKGFREGYAGIFLENMVDGIIVFDELGKIQAFNPVAEKFFYYTADEVLMEPVNKLIPKLNPQSCIQFMSNGKEKDESQGFGKEATGIRKNGFAIPLNLLVRKIDFTGCFLFMVIIRKK